MSWEDRKSNLRQDASRQRITGWTDRPLSIRACDHSGSAGGVARTKRNVQVHRFITRATFEERINDMIRAKRELAELIVGTGET